MNTKGIAFGVFDVFHVGQLRYLMHASSLCEHLYVGVRADFLKTPGKHKLPLFSETLRCEVIESLKCVYHAFVFHTSLDETMFWAIF